MTKTVPFVDPFWSLLGSFVSIFLISTFSDPFWDPLWPPLEPFSTTFILLDKMPVLDPQNTICDPRNLTFTAFSLPF